MNRFWKVTVLVVILAVVVAVLSGCSQTKTGNRIVDGKDVQTFTHAIVKIGDDLVVKGAVTQWRDYKDGDEVQVLIGGKYYLTHYSNVVLIADPEAGALAYEDPDWFTMGE